MVSNEVLEYTSQGLEAAADKGSYAWQAVQHYLASPRYRTACMADRYDRQQNDTVNRLARVVYDVDGRSHADFTVANNRIASNFFRQLNKQRATYSLGNGVSFVGTDNAKTALGRDIDRMVYKAGYYALIHGASYCFWNLDHVHVFTSTELCPLPDQDTLQLKAAVSFSRAGSNRPMMLDLFEADGYTKYAADRKGKVAVVQPKQPYVLRTVYTPFAGLEIVGEGDSYAELPIVPMYGSESMRSTLPGMRPAIDAYDIAASGFANDMQDVSQAYFIVENAGGMDDADLARFRDRLKTLHVAGVDSSEGSKVTQVSNDVPYQSRVAFLDQLRRQIYEGFGALDVTNISSAAKTATEINAAYQPLDDAADDFEYQVGKALRQLLALQGIDAEPVFKRNRISNVKEQVETVALEAQWLDRRTILDKLPNLTPDEVAEILDRTDSEDMGRLVSGF